MALRIAILSAVAVFHAVSAAASSNEAMIERFLTAIAVDPSVTTPTSAIELKDEEQLVALNPGRRSEIQAILATNHKCVTDVTRKASHEAFRRTAIELGPEKVGLLVEFYEGPERTRMASLAAKAKAGPPLTDVEKAEFEQMMSRYPLVEMISKARAYQDSLLAEDETIVAWRHCGELRNAELARRNIKF